MNKVQQYLGWIIAGVVLVAALGVFAGMALPLFADISSESEQITSTASGLKIAVTDNPRPAQEDIDGFRAARATLVQQYGTVLEFYDQHDKTLEQWFPNLNIGTNGYPIAASDFRSAYLTNMEALDKRVLEKLPGALGYTIAEKGDDFKIVRGFNWEKMNDPLMTDKLTNDRMRLFQKRFWIRSWLTDIALDPGLEVSRLLEVHFLLEDADFDQQVAVAGGGFGSTQSILGVEWEPGILPSKPGGGGRQTTIDGEFALIRGLGRTVTFGVAVMIPYAKIPDFLDRLQQVTEKGPLVHIVATKIYVQDQNPFAVKDKVEVGGKEEKLRLLEKRFGVQNPILAVTAYVIDVDVSKRENF